MARRSACGFSLVVMLLLAPMLIAPLAPNPSFAQTAPVQEAARLNAKAQRHLEAGRYAEGLEAATQALGLSEKSLGKDHPSTADSLQILGKLYVVSGKYSQAQTTHQRALSIRQHVLGPEHQDTARSLLDLADAYYQADDYAKAEPLYRRGLTIFEKVAGTKNRSTADALIGLAAVYTEMAEYQRAEPLLQRALAIAESVTGPNSAYTATALNRFAIMYAGMGSTARAATLFRRTLAIQEKTLGADAAATVNTLSNLATATFYLGSYVEAEAMQKKALAIRERVLGPEHPRTVRTMTNLADLYTETGAYAQAEALLKRAISIQRKMQQAALGDLAVSLNNLGSMYSDMGLQEKAEPLAKEGVALTEQVFGAKHPFTASHLANLGTIYRRMGAFERAAPLLARSLAVNEAVLGKQQVGTATSIYSLADLYSASGAYRKAERLYRRALAIYEKELGPVHPYTARMLRALAVVHWSRGESQVALALLQRVQRIQSANSASFLLTGSEARKQDYARTLTDNAFTTVSFGMSHPQAAATALALTSVLQYKGQVLDAVSGEVGRLRRSVAPADRALLEQLSDTIAELSLLTYGQGGELSPERYRKEAAQLAAHREQLESELASRNQAFRRELAVVTLANVQRAIPANAALVEWFRYTPFDPAAKHPATQNPRPRYVVYVLKRNGAPAAIDAGEADSIEVLARRLRMALANPNSSDFKQRAAELSVRLIAPLRPHLQGVQHLLFSPDAELNLVPMAALLDETGAYLGERFEVSYLTSGRELLQIHTGSTRVGRVVVMANPDYGNSGRVALRAEPPALQPTRSLEFGRRALLFRPLAGTAREAEELRKLLRLDPSDVLLGRDATETRLKNLAHTRILHIASHGFFLSDQRLAGELSKRLRAAPLSLLQRENPLLRSGIALAGANVRPESGDDGILTALEVTQLDLSATELVVLSACDSGLGEVQNGEGVYGLRRALALAGAQTQITSLWRVGDSSTATLMVDYYTRLLRGAGRAAALRSSQRGLRQNPALAHPYYWAGFIPIGNWNPLPGLSTAPSSPPRPDVGR